MSLSTEERIKLNNVKTLFLTFQNCVLCRMESCSLDFDKQIVDVGLW